MELQISKFELGCRPIVGGKECSKATAVGRAKLATEVIALCGISFQMFMHAREKGKTVLIWNPHVLEDCQLFTDWFSRKFWVAVFSGFYNLHILL